MNARPSLQFAMRLAGHLKMTLGELFTRMSSREFSMWLARHMYYEPVGGEWDQAATIAAAAIAPHCRRGKVPNPDDFIPVKKKKPQHWTQVRETLQQMAADLNQQQ